MLTRRDEISGGGETRRFHYSRQRFRTNLVIAMALTLLFCAAIWLVLGSLPAIDRNFWTTLGGMIFFAFISSRMLWLYWRDEVVLAVQPIGLYDGRIAAAAIPWEAIKEIVVEQNERDFRLLVYLWPRRVEDRQNPARKEADADYRIDLTPLEAPPQEIIAAIQLYKPIRIEH